MCSNSTNFDQRLANIEDLLGMVDERPRTVDDIIAARTGEPATEPVAGEISTRELGERWGTSPDATRQRIHRMRIIAGPFALMRTASGRFREEHVIEMEHLMSVLAALEVQNKVTAMMATRRARRKVLDEAIGIEGGGDVDA